MRALKRALGFLIFMACVAVTFFIRYANMDMTEMRLFFTFWKEFILITIISLTGLYLFYSE